MTKTQQTYPLVLQSAEMIAPNVRHLSFTREDGSLLDFIPGQFITFHFTVDDKVYRRSYSIASIPGQDYTIDIAASYVSGGAGSELLFNLKPGECVHASGPFGRLILSEETTSRYVLIATGTGVTPYRAMLPELTRRLKTHAQHTVVMMGVRSRNDLLYAKDFMRVAEQHHPQFDFRTYYSREFPTEPYQHEYHGYVQSGLQDLNLQPSHDIIYLCGNPNMIDTVFETLKNKGFETSRIRREKYISSK